MMEVRRLAAAWDRDAVREELGRLPQILAACAEDAVVYRARNTLVRMELASEDVVVKCHAPKRGWRRLLAGLLQRRDKAEQAFDHSTRLEALGLGVSSPRAALRSSDGAVYYISRWVPGCLSVWSLHDRSVPESDRHCADLGRFVAEMHERGAFHRDSTCGNILLTPPPPGSDSFGHVLVDTNRMRFGSVGLWAGLGSLVQLECQGRLLQAYIEHRGLSPGLAAGVFRLHLAIHRVRWFFKNGTRPLRRKLGL